MPGVATVRERPWMGLAAERGTSEADWTERTVPTAGSEAGCHEAPA
jgi:hypothetical protein